MKTFLIVVIIALATVVSFAQPREGLNKELSFSATYQNYSTGTGPSKSAFLFSPRFGFYVGDNFEIEPELLAMFCQHVRADIYAEWESELQLQNRRESVAVRSGGIWDGKHNSTL